MVPSGIALDVLKTYLDESSAPVEKVVLFRVFPSSTIGKKVWIFFRYLFHISSLYHHTGGILKELPYSSGCLR